MEHWTNMWNQLFVADDTKHLTVKWLEEPEEDQALHPVMILVCTSDDLILHVVDWEGEVAKKKPPAKDGSVPSEQVGMSGDPKPDDGADGTTRWPNPKKRRRNNEVTDGSGTGRGVKRKKVVSNLIIEDEDEPQAMSAHSIGLASSSTSTPQSPVPVFGAGTMNPPKADVDVTSVASSMYHSAFEFMPMGINDFLTSNIDVDFLQFPGLDIFENQDLLLGTPAGLL
jgi:hypothetical protein